MTHAYVGTQFLEKEKLKVSAKLAQVRLNEKDDASAALMLLVRCSPNEGERSGGKFKTSTSLKRGGALLIAEIGFDIESEMRFTLAESVEAERVTGSGKWAEHAPHANLTVVRPLLARAPLTAKLISRAT